MAIRNHTLDHLSAALGNVQAADQVRDCLNAAQQSIGGVHGATISVGVEGAGTANTINVVIQLTDELGNDLTEVGYVTAFLSDASTGIGITAAAPDGAVAIGTDGAIIKELTTKIAWILQSEADGDIDINIADTTGTPTWYLVVILPNGTQVVSSAITFA